MGELVVSSKLDRGSHCLALSDMRWVADGVIIRIWFARTDRFGLGQEFHLCFMDSSPCPCVTLQAYLDRCVSCQAVLLVHEDDTLLTRYQLLHFFVGR